MKYFQVMPKIATIDYVGNKIVLTNIMIRTEVIPSLLNNPLLFYSYNVQDGDTPEIIADKYYGDSYRYWIVLFANQIIDPQWQWPMNQNLFNDYIVDKYKNATANSLNISANTVTSGQVLAYTQSHIQNYVKNVITIDSSSNESNTSIYYIDSTAYNLVSESTTTKSFSTGAEVTQIIKKYTESIYDYEIRQNESNRSINLVNSVYVSQFESQFQSLLAQ
jgi:hypothetical protein